MAEKQASHRIETEARIVASDLRNERVGMWMAYSLTVALILVGIFLVLNGKDAAGYLSIFLPLAFSAINFLLNKHNAPEQSAKKKKDEP